MSVLDRSLAQVKESLGRRPPTGARGWRGRPHQRQHSTGRVDHARCEFRSADVEPKDGIGGAEVRGSANVWYRYHVPAMKQRYGPSVKG